ncbi:type I secretion C-terminal target domain-containing protein [Roseibium sp. MB-4]
MTKIYIGTSANLYGTVYDHLFLVKAPNDDLTTQTYTHKLIEAGPSLIQVGPIAVTDKLVVVNDASYTFEGNALDKNGDGDLNDPGDLQPADKGLISVDTSSIDEDVFWDNAVEYVSNLGPQDNTMSIDTGYLYGVGLHGPNSNSVIISVLATQGINIADNLPTGTYVGDTSLAGYQHLLDSNQDVIMTVFSGQPERLTFHDKSGNDFIIVQDGALLDITKDEDTSSWNNIVMDGRSNLNGLYLAKAGNDLEIRGTPVNILSDIVDIEDHFDPAGGFNSKYLFITSGSVTHSNIDLANNTVSGVTIHRQIDTRLLGDVEWDAITGSVALSDVFTVNDENPNVTGNSGDEFIIGNSQNNILIGGDGSDQFFGGAGIDTVDYSTDSSSITADLTALSVIDGFGKTDTLENIENIIGTNFDDDFVINSLVNEVDGGTGHDIVSIKDTFFNSPTYTSDTSAINILWKDDGSFLLDTGTSLKNVEEFNTSNGAQLIFSAETMGNNYSSIIPTGIHNNDHILDYSTYNSGGITIDIANKTVSSGGLTDQYNNQFGIVVGTNAGDTISHNSTVDSGGLWDFYSGTGDDDIYNWNGAYHYSGGNDNFYQNVMGIHQTQTNIIVPETISSNDITVSFSQNQLLVNYTPTTQVYSYDVVYTIGSLGTITFNDVVITHNHQDVGDGLKWYYNVGDGSASLNNQYLTNLPTFNKEILGSTVGVVESVYGGLLSDLPSPSLVTSNNSYIAKSFYGSQADEVIDISSAGNNDFEDGLYLYGGDDDVTGSDYAESIYLGNGNDTSTGGAGNDAIYGGFGDDSLLDGGEGDDIVSGGAGDDVLVYNLTNGGTDYYYGGSGTDTLRIVSDQSLGASSMTREEKRTLAEQLGEFTLYTQELSDPSVSAGNGYKFDFGLHASDFENIEFVVDNTPDNTDNFIFGTLLGSVVDLINLGAGNDLAFGYGGNDTLNGEDGDDFLNGGLGSDILNGGLGTDTADYSDESTQQKIDLVAGTAENNLGDVDTLTSIENIIGSDHADEISGDAIANDLQGGKGNDILSGGAGVDVISGGEGNDIIRHYLASNLSNADNYYAGTGRDTLEIHFDTEAQYQLFAAELESYKTYLRANSDITTDNLLVTTSTGIVLSDFERVDSFVGGVLHKANEDIDGTSSADTIYGVLDSTNEIFNALDGDDTVYARSGHDTLNGGDGFDVLYGMDGDDTLNGDAGNDFLAGGDGDDHLNGGIGHDTLEGGLGVDIAYAGEGNDRLVGDEGDDTLYGETGSDRLIGGVGNDTLDGGDGLDVADYSAAANAVHVNLYNGVASDDGDGGSDTLISIEDVTGSAGNDTLTGDTGDNVLRGEDGDDFIYGYDGNDTLYGGAGNDELRGQNGTDTYYAGDGNDLIYSDQGDTAFGEAGDDVFRGYGGTGLFDGGDGTDRVWWRDYMHAGNVGLTVDLAAGTATDGDNNVATLVSIENITGSSYNDILHGDNNINIIRGGGNYNGLTDGDDTIYGYGGNDKLYGDAGIDTIYGGDGDDTISGNDGDDVLHGGDGVDYITGDAGDDTIYAGGGNDEIYAGAGIDTVYGGDGNDILRGEEDADILFGDDGADYLYGYGDNDNLTGGAGIDRMYGGDGDDTLTFDQDSDRMWGGNGADDFIAEEGSLLNHEMSYIYDFLESEDQVDISALLVGYNSSIHNLSDFVNVAQGYNTTIQVDRDGTAGTHGWDNVVRLQGNTTISTDVSLLVDTVNNDGVLII